MDRGRDPSGHCSVEPLPRESCGPSGTGKGSASKARRSTRAVPPKCEALAAVGRRAPAADTASDQVNPPDSAFRSSETRVGRVLPSPPDCCGKPFAKKRAGAFDTTTPESGRPISQR